MIQAPNLQNIYPATPYQQPYISNPVAMPVPQADYNAVKIAINGATVQAGGAQQSGYATPTMPYYSYPQAQMYDYPQATQQPYYMPLGQAVQQPSNQGQCCVCTPCAETASSQTVPNVVPVAVPVMPQAVPAPQITPQVMQQNINSPVVAPAPVIPQQQMTNDTKSDIAEQPQVEVKQPDTLQPQIDINEFIASLTNPDFEKQAVAMESIAMMVNEDPKKATELLDERVINSLTNIMNADTKALVGPSKEQMEAREKILAGKKVSPEEEELANTMTPREQAERNKSYALFTTAILEKLFADEVEKISGQVVPFTELPGANSVVEQMKSNPNPTVRTSALEALSYVQRPEYKADLNTVFAIAAKDQDKSVQETAKVAIEKLNA